MGQKDVDMEREPMRWREYISASIYSPLIVLMFILTVFFYQNHYGLEIVMYLGWGVWMLSIILAIAPIIILKRRGGVPKGRSYMHTSRLVTDGLYGIVRHPQYTGGLLLIIAMMMVSQHWIVLLAGVVALAAFYPDIAVEDQKLVGMFGRPYELYMKRVPRTNFILGLARAARRAGAPEGNGQA